MTNADRTKPSPALAPSPIVQAALDELLGGAAWNLLGPARIAAAVERAIAAAVAEARAAMLADVLLAEDVAAVLGVSRQHVHRLAVQAGIGHPVGRRGVRLYLPADVDRLRALIQNGKSSSDSPGSTSPSSG